MSLETETKFEFTDFEQVALEKRDKERDKKIAKAMLEEGATIQFIAKVTGLTKEEIEKL